MPNNVTVDPRVLELGTALSQGYTSLTAKQMLQEHAASGRYSRKAAKRAAKRAIAEQLAEAREARWS